LLVKTSTRAISEQAYQLNPPDMKWKKILLDPSFWILLGVNIFLVYKYEQTPGIFITLIWLYWSQNVLYGLSNFADMLTSGKVDVSGGASILGRSNKNDDLPGNFVTQKAVKSDKEIASDMAWGFILLFGFFHLVLGIFLATMTKRSLFDWGFYLQYLLIFSIFQLISFIQHKIQNRDKAANITRMSTLPYLRVVPVHLCILIPAFLHLSNLLVFLVLKVIIDIVMYVRITRYYQKNNIVAEATAINIDTIN
jgi:hypothetical protein